jgi:hypothetical protein
MEELRAALTMLRAHIEEHECARCRDMMHELVNLITEAALLKRSNDAKEVTSQIKTKKRDKAGAHRRWGSNLKSP